MTNDNDFLKELNQIGKVDVSPFLITRITGKIAEGKTEWIPRKKAIAFAFSFIILLVINFFAIRQFHSRGEKNIAQTFQLMPDNNLYQ